MGSCCSEITKSSKKNQFYDDCINAVRHCFNEYDDDDNEHKYDGTYYDNITNALTETISKLKHEDNDDDNMEENSLLYKISNGIIITFLALTEASQDFVISTTHLYRIFASLPILKDILPNDGDDPHNDAVRPNHSDGYFYNHSLNVISKPKIMKYIKNKKDILDLLSQVNNDKNGRLRIAQYAHSYSNLFVEDLSMKNE
eukprot:51892_1